MAQTDGCEPVPARVEIGVSPRRINEIVHGKRAITADTALRLARFFGTDAQSWLNLQSLYDMEKAQIETGKALQKIIAGLNGLRLNR